MNTFQKPNEPASLNLSTTTNLDGSCSSVAVAAAFGLLLGGFGGKRNQSNAESVGTESLISVVDLMEVKGSSFPHSKVSRSRKERMSRVGRFKGVVFEDFPPFLSTLDEKSGRPRFDVVKERGDGRLLMVMIRNEEPVIVRSCGGEEESDGVGVRMEMVMTVQLWGRVLRMGKIAKEITTISILTPTPSLSSSPISNFLRYLPHPQNSN